MTSKAENSIFNVSELRAKAQKSIKDGAVTPDYPLNVDQACYLLNQALASEILCVLRYRHHQIIAKGINRIELAAEFEEHAKSEEEHMMMIAERINQLGGNPDFNPDNISKNSATEYGKAKDDIVALIKEDLIAERVVIEVYRKLIEFFGVKDPTTRRMFEHILADEEEHADDLSDLLSGTDSSANLDS